MNLRERIIFAAMFGMAGVLLFHLMLFVPISWGYKVEWIFPYELLTVGALAVVALGGMAVDVFKR